MISATRAMISTAWARVTAVVGRSEPSGNGDRAPSLDEQCCGSSLRFPDEARCIWTLQESVDVNRTEKSPTSLLPAERPDDGLEKVRTAGHGRGDREATGRPTPRYEQAVDPTPDFRVSRNSRGRRFGQSRLENTERFEQRERPGQVPLAHESCLVPPRW